MCNKLPGSVSHVVCSLYYKKTSPKKECAMILDSPYLFAYCTALVAVLGLCMGSFLNCMAWRMTHGESVLRGRSHCTSCGHALGPLDLVPVLSWAFSRGKCRYCGEHVSWRYPATELLCAIVYVSIWLVYGFTIETIELIGFASVLLVLSLTDLDTYIIPNATIIAAIAIRALYLVATGLLGTGDALTLARDSLIGGVVIVIPVYVLSIVMDRVLGRNSLGGGDVKLLFVAGLYFGWVQCMFLIIVACILGLLLGAIVSRDSKYIPFGPAIALACWLCMLVGGQAVSWYLGLVGL